MGIRRHDRASGTLQRLERTATTALATSHLVILGDVAYRPFTREAGAAWLAGDARLDECTKAQAVIGLMRNPAGDLELAARMEG